MQEIVGIVKTGEGAGDVGFGWRFGRHYLEMVVAMMFGMMVLGGVVRMAVAAAGQSAIWTQMPDLVWIEMSITMSIPMIALMRYRKHSWYDTFEMTAAMLVPYWVVIAIPRAFGPDAVPMLAGRGEMMWSHAAMLLGMLAQMIVRRDRYRHCH